MPTLTPMMSVSHATEKKTAIYAILSWAGSTHISTNPLLRPSWEWAQSGSLPPAIWMWIKLSRSAVIGATPRRCYRSWWMMAWGCWRMLGTLVCFFPVFFLVLHSVFHCRCPNDVGHVLRHLWPPDWIALDSLSLSVSSVEHVAWYGGAFPVSMVLETRRFLRRIVTSFFWLGIASLEVAGKERSSPRGFLSLRDVAHCNIQNGFRIMQPHRFPLIFGF